MITFYDKSEERTILNLFERIYLKGEEQCLFFLVEDFILV